MADIFSKEKRSEVMSKIHSSNTKPELKHKAKNINFEYQPKAFGSPDFIDWKNKTVIFIDGCFWHKCPMHYKKPKSNEKYWKQKIRKNILRDKEVGIVYRNAGWKVVRIWEHDL